MNVVYVGTYGTVKNWWMLWQSVSGRFAPEQIVPDFQSQKSLIGDNIIMRGKEVPTGTG